MRRLFIPLLILVGIAVCSVADRPAADASLRRTFRVVTFNIYKGAGDDDRYDLGRTIEALARLDGDVVGVQEALRNHPQFNCDDQPALIAEGLRRLTGRRWSHVYARGGTSDNRECLARGRGDGVATEGLALLTPDRILETAHIDLPGDRVGVMVRVASMPDVPVIVTHLTAYRRNQALRLRQIEMLLPWAGRHGPAILMGDFNAWPGTIELTQLLAHYRDAWEEARARGINRGVGSGSTRPGYEARIDFVFYPPLTPLSLESVDVVDTSSAGSVEVSDHRPVVAAFRRVSRNGS
jgi:endonuclease/exonuclease/phosphatase family metal-dependent hydrolase